MNTSIIIIDCGGIIFKTTKSTLLKASFFRTYLDKWNDDSKPLFVDCDPELFRHFLNLLRDPNYTIPSDMLSNISSMADYFGLEIKLESDPYITIDCAGTIFKTTKSTLDKIPLLDIPESGDIFIDYDPKIFGHFLNLLRDSDYNIPNDMLKNVYSIAKKYEFDYHISELYTYYDTTQYYNHTKKFPCGIKILDIIFRINDNYTKFPFRCNVIFWNDNDKLIQFDSKLFDIFFIPSDNDRRMVRLTKTYIEYLQNVTKIDINNITWTEIPTHIQRYDFEYIIIGVK